MISFSILDAESLAPLAERFSLELSDEEYISDILSSFLELSGEGIEVALTAASGCLLARVYEEKYSFVYPIEVSGEADVAAALILLSEYARHEMIPFYLSDVPREELSLVGEIFPHIEARAYGEDEDSFVVGVLNECDLVAYDAHSAAFGSVRLTDLLPEDKERYARLSRDEAVNRYWGYDYKMDAPDADEEYFLKTAERELYCGVALSLAVRPKEGEGALIGEVVLFDFDYRGSAMLAIRLLPEYQGRGLGTEALRAALHLASGIGLKTLRARVKLENIASIKMTERVMRRLDDKDGEAVFIYNF